MPVWPSEPRPRLALAVATGLIVLAAGGGAVAQLDGGNAPPASVGTAANHGESRRVRQARWS